jgi:hypothetical protein
MSFTDNCKNISKYKESKNNKESNTLDNKHREMIKNIKTNKNDASKIQEEIHKIKQ